MKNIRIHISTHKAVRTRCIDYMFGVRNKIVDLEEKGLEVDKELLSEYRTFFGNSDMAIILNNLSEEDADENGFVTFCDIDDSVADFFNKQVESYMAERNSKMYWFSTKKNAHKVETGTYAYERINGGATAETIRARELIAGAYGRPIQVNGKDYALLMGFIEYRANFAGREAR